MYLDGMTGFEELREWIESQDQVKENQMSEKTKSLLLRF